MRGLLFLAWALAGCATESVELLPPGGAPVVDGTEEPPLGDPGAPAMDITLPEDPSSQAGCQKVDFLFVVDNSRSMQTEQENLVRSFPGFMQVVEGTVRARDYQVMVTDTDASRGQRGLAAVIGQDFSCQPAPACCQSGCDGFTIPVLGVPSVDSCNGVPCDQVSLDADLACEGVLGAGKRYTPDGTSCGVDGERRYMVSGQPELADTFACAGQVGTFGDGDEQPMAAMMQAVSLPLNGAGGCNAGFLRAEAVLVVTFITDGEDSDSPGDPQLWRQALIDAKGGDEDAVVLLGLMGGDGCGVPAPRLDAFVRSLPFGSSGSVCAEDYAPFFSAAVSVIDNACDVFVPVIR